MSNCENKFITLVDLARQAKIMTGNTACVDGKFSAGLPFSAYPTGVDVTTIVGTNQATSASTSERAVLSGNNITDLFDVANPLSPDYIPVFSASTYSGFTWSNPLYSANTINLELPILPMSAASQVTPYIWDVTLTGMNGDHQIDLEYTGYSISYSFSPVTYEYSGSSLVDISGVTGYTTARYLEFSATSLDYKGPLDYIHSNENVVAENRLIGKKLQITEGASASTVGSVLTLLDSEGNVGWEEGGGEFTGNTSGNCINDLWVNNISGCTTDDLNISVSSGQKIHLTSERIELQKDQNDNTSFAIINVDNDVESRSSLGLTASGLGGVETSGVLTYIGENFNSVGTFQGQYLPNTLNLTTGGGGPADRANINIGPRSTTGVTRFFGGGDNFEPSTYLGKFSPDGLYVKNGVIVGSTETISGSSVYIKGDSSTSTGPFDDDNIALRVVNSSDDNLLLVKNDSTVSINGNFSGLIGGSASLNIYGLDAGSGATTNVLSLKDSNTNTIGTVGSDARFRLGASLENTLVKIGNPSLTGEDAKLHISPSTNPGGGNTWPFISDYMLKIDGFENTGAPWTSYVSNIFNVDNFGNVNSVGKITAGELEITKPGDNANLFTAFDLSSPGFKLSGKTDSELVFSSVISPNAGGITIGCRGLNALFPGYGKQGDGFVYSSVDQNGLNLISQPTFGPQTTDDYIRFYAGNDANGTTPDVHIQGSGATRGYVGIQTETPTSELDVNGDVNISGSLTVGSQVIGNTTTVDSSADPNVNGVDIVFYSSGSPGGTITLNNAMNVAGYKIELIRTSTTASATLAGSSINGGLTMSLPTAVYSKTTCVSNGSGWFCTNQTP